MSANGKLGACWSQVNIMAQRLQQIASHLGSSQSNGPQRAPTDPSRVDGYVVLVTGGAQGLGRAAANLLASKGAKIFIAHVSEAKASEAVRELRASGYEAASVVGDVLEVGFAEKAVKAALQAFGRVNCLINNAGFCYDAAIHKTDDEKWDIMKIHNYVPFRMVRALSAHWMDPANRGMPKTVVNISCTSSVHGQMGQINYSTAKMGVVGLTKTVASDYVVGANAVAYGRMDRRLTRPPTGEETVATGGKEIVTGISERAKKFRDTSEIPLGRCGTLDDAAGVVLFLASPLSSYMTGTCIECDGGRFM